MRIRFAAFLLSLMFVFVFSGITARAQEGGAPAVTLAAFQASPGIVLSAYPSGGPGMVALVAEALAADIDLLDKIIALIDAANPAQRAAIGAGLGRAAKYYETLAEKAVDDAAREAAVNKAELIARAVAKTENPVVMASFALGTGDTPAAIPAVGGQAADGGPVGRSATGGDEGGSDSSGGAAAGMVTTGSSDYLSAGGGESYTGEGGGTSASPTT